MLKECPSLIEAYTKHNKVKSIYVIFMDFVSCRYVFSAFPQKEHFEKKVIEGNVKLFGIK